MSLSLSLTPLTLSLPLSLFVHVLSPFPPQDLKPSNLAVNEDCELKVSGRALQCHNYAVDTKLTEKVCVCVCIYTFRHAHTNILTGPFME